MADDSSIIQTSADQKLVGASSRQEDEFVAIAQSYSGPVMPPHLLREVEKIIPGGAERVLALSEKEQAYRHDIVRKSMAVEKWQIQVSLLGGLAAFVFLISGIIYCAVYGHTAGVVALGSIGAFGVISHIIKLPRKGEQGE